jgi:hypothetical protein
VLEPNYRSNSRSETYKHAWIAATTVENVNHEDARPIDISSPE